MKEGKGERMRIKRKRELPGREEAAILFCFSFILDLETDTNDLSGL